MNQSMDLNTSTIGKKTQLNHLTVDHLIAEENQIMSDRNSVAEFEMLEQECIAKYLKN